MLATYYMNPGAGQLHWIEPELCGLCVQWPAMEYEQKVAGQTAIKRFFLKYLSRFIQ